MGNKSKSLTVVFGALAPPLSEQVPSLNKMDAKRFQNHADCITRLSINSILTGSEVHRARTRLLKQIKKAITP